MAILRRRDRQAGDTGWAAADLDQLDLDAVRDAVLDTAGAELGTRPTAAEGPEPLLAGYGPDAYRMRLATGDAAWSGPLIVREGEDEDLAREAAWLRAAAAGGFPAPSVVTGPSSPVLAFRQPAGATLTERMLIDMPAIPKLLAGFGELHARLHRLPTGSLPAPAAGSDPVDTLEAGATSEAVRGEISNELGWLRRRRPATTAPVACHGLFNPIHVYLEGGDFSSAVPVNWTQARVIEREFDVAATVTAFWSAPLYVENAMYRKGMQMARQPLIDAYQEAYGASAPGLDDAALRYWQVLHLTQLLADAARRRHGELGGPWDTARGVVDPTSAMDEIRTRIRNVAAG
jgi:hypothetical protein